MQNLPYEEQLHLKQAKLIKLLGRFGRVDEILGMEEPTHYRNKIHAAFALDGRKKVISGIYQPGSHAIVPVDACMIEDAAADAVIRDIRDMLPDFKIKVYDERSCTGWLRHVLIRRGFQSGEIMVEGAEVPDLPEDDLPDEPVEDDEDEE